MTTVAHPRPAAAVLPAPSGAASSPADRRFEGDRTQDPQRAARAAVLRAHGATDAEVAELLAYGDEDACTLPSPPSFPLADEPFAAAWDDYAAAADQRGAWPVLREVLVQLRFPVQGGISETHEYRRATRAGDPSGVPEQGATLENPAGLRVWMHATPAGRVPVILAGARADFETLVRAITARNEPKPIPASMGACIVAGYPNWDRVARHRHAWAAAHPSGDWDAEFRALIPRRELYQDRFILLSPGPYSGVPAPAVGRTEREWARESVALRLEHECAHYFTRRVLGSMRNTLRDELVADFAGIRAAAGRFRADWLLAFLGLESFPDYRPGARLENYRGTLSDGAFVILQRLVHAAAAQLSAFAAALPPAASDDARAAVLLTLCAHSLEEIASGALTGIARGFLTDG